MVKNRLLGLFILSEDQDLKENDKHKKCNKHSQNIYSEAYLNEFYRFIMFYNAPACPECLPKNFHWWVPKKEVFAPHLMSPVVNLLYLLNRNII